MKCKRKAHLRFTVFYPRLNLYQVGVTHMVLTDSQKVVLSISPVDKKGKVARVDGIPVWMSSDLLVLDVVAAPDGMSAVATSLDLGHAQVSVMADADLGEGVTLLTGVEEVDVVAGQAVALAISAGVPSEQ